MKVFVISKAVARTDAHRKPMIIAAITAVIMSFFAGCQEQFVPAPDEPNAAYVPASTEIDVFSQKVKQSVKKLEYSDAVVADFATMAISWKDSNGQPVLAGWKKTLDEAKRDYEEGELTKEQLARMEWTVMRELSQRIKKEICYEEKFFGLGDVVKHKQADYLGYSQIIYALGNCVGLSVQVIEATDLAAPAQIPKSTAYIACIATLTNDKKAVVDVATTSLMISQPFDLEKTFRKVGSYWELKNEDNPLRVHARIHILNKDGLVAAIYNNRANTYTDSGQPEQAISILTQAIELAPKFAWPYLNRANLWNRRGEPTKALPDYDRAIEINPQFTEAYNARGVAHTKLQRYNQAFSDFDQAIRHNPKYTKAYCNRGKVYLGLNQPDKAIVDFNDAIILDPNYPNAYNYRGVAYFSSQQFEQALLDFNQAVRLNPDYAEAHFNRGNVYLKSGQSRQAVVAYTEAIKLNPKWPQAYFRRGFAYSRFRSYDEAIQDYNETIKLDSGNPQAYYRRAIAYSKIDKPNEALSDLTQAITLNPNYADAYIARASTYAFLEKGEEAKQDLYKAVELNPALKEYAQKISDQFELGLQLDNSSGPDGK